MESSSSSGSSKRAKAAGNINQIVYCLVDGCNADLSLYREYHRRHKVCEVHSKTPKVTVGGHEQRFCQQCSRFHSLTEFDEGKRSCRKRLEGHNRRRRKLQRDSSRNSGLVSFSSQQTLPSAVVNSDWARAVKIENEPLLYSSHQRSDYADQQSSFPRSSAQSYHVNQFQFLQGTDQSHPEATICQQVLDPNSMPGNNNSCPITLSDELNPVFECNRALSLLSSAPAVTVNSGGICLNQMVQLDPNHSQLSMHRSGLVQYCFKQEVESKPVVSPTDPNATAKHTHRTFQDDPGPGGSSSGKSHQTLTFSWE